ncbi:MAG: hypothetical protein IPM46_06485 [Flavobacteriales bacterium]|nr:hypothetical protein [Flavobacteriales bacterium]
MASPATHQNPTVSVAGTYDLTVTGDNGCQSFASAEVELDDAAPGAQAAGGTLTCDVTSIQLQGTGNGSFDWTGPGGFTSNHAEPHGLGRWHLRPHRHRCQRLPELRER